MIEKKPQSFHGEGVQLCSLNFLGQLLVIMQNTIPMVDNQHFLVETY
jgi:hypothetical protein